MTDHTPDARLRVAFFADDSNACTAAVLQALHADHEIVPLQADQGWVAPSVEVARTVAQSRAQFGVLMCWTGTGTAIAANTVPGVRAATAHEPWVARNARLWNDANVLALSHMRLAPSVAVECVQAFLSVEAPDPDEAASIAALRALNSPATQR